MQNLAVQFKMTSNSMATSVTTTTEDRTMQRTLLETLTAGMMMSRMTRISPSKTPLPQTDGRRWKILTLDINRTQLGQISKTAQGIRVETNLRPQTATGLPTISRHINTLKQAHGHLNRTLNIPPRRLRTMVGGTKRIRTTNGSTIVAWDKATVVSGLPETGFHEAEVEHSSSRGTNGRVPRGRSDGVVATTTDLPDLTRVTGEGATMILMDEETSGRAVAPRDELMSRTPNLAKSLVRILCSFSK